MLEENIDTENLFKLSSEYINNILKDEEILQELKESCENENIQLINKSISYVLYDKNELFSNNYKIEMNIECKIKTIGSYILYLDKDQNFIDEFFVIN
ncbi:hypothetical protein SAMN05421846_103143 [Chryseobacterium taeanense]|uniref:Uncharacterized protein n=1 Tax=Chryseobacterium taeanense TaxID=311334 RepID=A0A1G8GXA7_9FLAO|nr:hypothetical protein [Chryseobacterium taeanense]SDH98860.1 hypothetical protein SAMN05421846_103143 [Chryseobacterium taeanense]